MNVRDTEYSFSDHHGLGVTKVVALLDQPAALLSCSGQIINQNSKFADQIGQTPNSKVKPNIASLLSKADRFIFQKFLDHQAIYYPELVLTLWPTSSTPISARISRFSNDGQPETYLCQIVPKKPGGDTKLNYIMEHIDLGVWDYDIQSNSFSVSDAWRQMRGLPKGHPINEPSEKWLQNVHPDDRENLWDLFKGQSEGCAKSIVIQYRHRHTQGHWVWILCRASVMEVDASGRPTKIVGTDTDITHVKAQEEDLSKLTGKLQLAIEASGMGIWEFDPSTSCVHWDDRMLEIYGIKDGKNERSGNLWETHIHPDDLAETVAYADDCNEKNADFVRDYRIVHPDGKIRHVRSLARNVSISNTQSKLIGVNIDVTNDYLRAEELEIARRQSEYDSRHDALTGLGNRRKSDEETLALFNRISDDHRYVVMQIDLDHFKVVNDTLGHSAGDYVLTVVAKKLTRVFNEQAQVFRVGGDEFAILFENAPKDAELKRFCQTLIKSLSEPMSFEGQDCSIGVSIGYAIGTGPPDNPSEIFINADTALYSAKHAGRSNFKAYSRQLDSEVSQVANVRQSLLDAMKNGEIMCYFQPLYDAKSLEICGAEALVRWQCPNRGLLTPDKFLPQATEAGLLPDIDEHVFLHVAAQQSDWAALGIPFPRISINTSRERLESKGLIQQVKDVIDDHHLISFELLETAFLDTIDTSLAFKLDALRELGLRIELDDFGSGHSSIAALQAVKPDGVKIDRTLIAPLETKPSQLLTLKSLVKIARLEAADITIEGLETGIQLAAIRDLDCDALQGYTLQRPMPALEFAAALKRASKTSKTATN